MSSSDPAIDTAPPSPAPKLTTIGDYANSNTKVEELRRVLSDTKLDEWVLPNYDTNTSQTNPNDPEQEARRLMVLHSYGILDTNKEDEFEVITKEATAYFDVPIAVVSLVDMGRQWFKSIQGFPASETPRCISFCQHVVKRKQRLGPLIVEDTTLDDRFKENPLVAGEPNFRFYAGAPLISPEGHTLGTFCLLDFQPRTLSEVESKRLESFAQEAMFYMISRESTPSRRVSC